MGTIRIALTYRGPAAAASAKLANNTHEYAIAHARVSRIQLQFKDGDTVLATFNSPNPAYEAALRRYKVQSAAALPDLDRDYTAAANRSLYIDFRVRYYDFFLQIAKHMVYDAADNLNFADPPDEDAVTGTFASVANIATPTDTDWTVTFHQHRTRITMPARQTAWTRNGNRARLGLRLHSDDMAADHRLNLLHYLIAADWSAYYDDVDNHDVQATANTPWSDNLKAFMLRYIPLTRGARLITRAKTRGWTACQAAGLDVTMDADDEQQSTVTAVRDEIDRFLITANPWGDATNAGAYPSAVHIALAALYIRFQITPISLVRYTLDQDITATDTLNMVAQIGMGNCAEHADVAFKVIRDLMTERPAASAMLRCVVRTGYLNIDHAFVVGGERPAAIVDALLRRDHNRGPRGDRIDTWDSFAAVAGGGGGVGRRGWICDPYLAPGAIPTTLALLGDEDRLRQWLTWRGAATIYPLGTPAGVRDATNAATAGHIHIPDVCDQTAPAVTSIVPVDGPAGGGTVVTFTGTHFDSRCKSVFGTQWGTNDAFTNSTTVAGTTQARAAGTVLAAIINHDNQPPYVGNLDDAFTYRDPPTITDVAANFGSANGGKRIRIRGTNFVAGIGATTVSFNGSAGTNVNVVNTGELTVRTPPHAQGVVAVSVTTRGGTVASANAFTFVTPPVVTGIAPGNAPAGAIVTITGTTFRMGVTVTFDGAPCVVARIDATTLIVTAPAHALGAVDVIVRNPEGLAFRVAGGFTYVAPPPPPGTKKRKRST